MISEAEAKSSRTIWRAVLILTVIIVVPCAYGFITRLSRLIAIAGTDPVGAFAIIPIFNYMAASLGFVMLMIWALFHGMFRDIEKPKYDLLEREAWLDAPLDDDGNDSADGANDRDPSSDHDAEEPQSVDERLETVTSGSIPEAVHHG